MTMAALGDTSCLFQSWCNGTLLAIERLDTWVLIVSIAVPVVSIVGLVLFHFLGLLAGNLRKPRRAVRESPEPPAPRAAARDDPEQMQRTCAAMEESLAEQYLELAECWLRKGQPQQAIKTFEKVAASFPESRQAATAQERIRQVRETSESIQPAGSSKPI
jgi:hypothetical protein